MCATPCFAAGPAKKAEGAVSLIPLSRANNISIMLTQFSNFRRGPADIRRAVCAGELGPERLSLLLQASTPDHSKQRTTNKNSDEKNDIP